MLVSWGRGVIEAASFVSPDSYVPLLQGHCHFSEGVFEARRINLVQIWVFGLSFRSNKEAMQVVECAGLSQNMQ